MAKKGSYKWTPAQRKAASQRMKARYAAKRSTAQAPPLKLGGLTTRLVKIGAIAEELVQAIDALITAIDSL